MGRLSDRTAIVTGGARGIGRHYADALAAEGAQVMIGDKAAARKSYQDFLTLWRDADPGIPIYKQAKAEHANLRD